MQSSPPNICFTRGGGAGVLAIRLIFRVKTRATRPVFNTLGGSRNFWRLFKKYSSTSGGALLAPCGGWGFIIAIGRKKGAKRIIKVAWLLVVGNSSLKAFLFPMKREIALFSRPGTFPVLKRDRVNGTSCGCSAGLFWMGFIFPWWPAQGHGIGAAARRWFWRGFLWIPHG